MEPVTEEKRAFLRGVRRRDLATARASLDGAAATLDLEGEYDEATELRVAARKLVERFQPPAEARS